MCLKSGICILLSIIAHTANLQETLAVTASNLRAIVVKLAIVDIIFMLRVYREHIVRLSLLTAFIILL